MSEQRLWCAHHLRSQKMKPVTITFLFWLLTLSGCVHLVENQLQRENRKMYENEEITYPKYKARDRYLDQLDQQFD